MGGKIKSLTVKKKKKNENKFLPRKITRCRNEKKIFRQKDNSSSVAETHHRLIAHQRNDPNLFENIDFSHPEVDICPNPFVCWSAYNPVSGMSKVNSKCEYRLILYVDGLCDR